MASPALWDASAWVGPWGDCDSSCGGGWQERPLLCALAPGLLGEAWQCAGAGLASVPASQPCQYALSSLLPFFPSRAG